MGRRLTGVMGLGVLFAVLLGFGVRYHPGRVGKPEKLIIPAGVTIENESKGWEKTATLAKSDSCKLDFVKIQSLSLGKADDELYITFRLGGQLPQIGTLPKCETDQVTGVFYYLNIDDNYFDGSGQKNPSNYEARMKVGFYGYDLSPETNNRITVGGELVAGGWGYDYFTVRYPLSEVIRSTDASSLVVTARSLAMSKNWPLGVSGFRLRNSAMAATPEDITEVKVELGTGN